MKTLGSILFEDSFRLSGMIFIFISASIFGISISLDHNETNLTAFLLCYCITFFFSFSVLLRAIHNHRWKISKSNIEYTTLMLISWLISAFAFNKEMSVFDNSTNWLSIYICLACLSIISTTFQNQLSLSGRHVLSFFLGASLVLFTYYAIYLIPIYAMGILAAIFIGLSLHAFIPLFLSIVILTVTLRSIKAYPVLKYSFLTGLFIPLVPLGLFIYQWISIQEKVKSGQDQYKTRSAMFPEWTTVAQQLPQSSVAEKFLKADLVYATPNTLGNWLWGNFGQGSFDEARKHDPMVVVSAFLVGKSTLTEKDRIQILKSTFNSRHLAQERLWSGDNLITSHIATNVKIYPEYRMAYTEKTVSIKNTDTRGWRNSQEAIYTFQLPEGSVVSALSLWINGIEQAARLTTKGKADSAYKQIVGIENRDPSVIHWQEGNQVTLRVFPCTVEEQRKFKIGITSPMFLERKRLIYQNTNLKGPSPKNATETIQVNFSTHPSALNTDLVQSGNTYSADGTYRDDWQLSFAQAPLSAARFSFAGAGYQLKEAPSISTHFKPTAIYLDINNSWTREELTKLWPNIKSQNVYAFDERLIRLNDQNLNDVFKKLDKVNFSLFPFYKISDTEQALVITKGCLTGPNLSDLGQSDFQQATTDFLSKTPPIHLFNIGESLSPYLQTLKQFGILRYNHGDLAALNSNLQQNNFVDTQELSDAITIPGSGLMIQKNIDASDENAPDQLLRLFAYHDILKKIGPAYFRKNYVNNQLLKIADQAFIVSPVSSLIVLETKKDYDRFDIDESKNSLKNASMQSSGAAPEPQEWLLILLCASVIIYFSRQSSYFMKLKSKWS